MSSACRTNCTLCCDAFFPYFELSILASYAGHTQQLQSATRFIEAAGPIAWWRVLAVTAGNVALVCGAAFLSQVEKRLPLVYFKTRRFQALPYPKPTLVDSAYMHT